MFNEVHSIHGHTLLLITKPSLQATALLQHLKQSLAITGKLHNIQRSLDDISSGSIILLDMMEADKKLIGYIGIKAVIDEGYITNIAVFPEFRRRGVAKALLNKVFEFAKEKGLSFVSLEVRPSNTEAISLYEKTGFKEEGRRKNFYRLPLEDALIMTKRFSYENIGD